MAKAAKKAPAAENHFEFEGKKYKVLIPKMNIPGIGERTSLEVCVDEEAQAYLVGCNCLGSVIEEVID